MDLSIVIVSYNVSNLLRACLESIYHTRDGLRLEVIVVDNASTDESVKMVRDHFPEVIVIANDANRGFAAANNQAIRLLQGRYILLLNPDTVIRSHALQTMIDTLEKDVTIGIVGPKLLNPDGTLQRSCRSFPNIINYAIYSYASLALLPNMKIQLPFLLCSWDHAKRAELKTGFMLGAALLVPSEVFNQVGLLDEGFFVYGEEKDFTYRVNRRGYKIVYNPESEVIHYGGQSSRQVSQAALNYLYDSYRYFLHKNYRPVSAYMLIFILYTGLLTKWIQTKFINSVSVILGRKPRQPAVVYWNTFTTYFRSKNDGFA